ncbi:MAG TPA: glycoside hydrolase family 3 N-terminal domain-containing protein, partial [Candidatus Pacearchaeota archaeon]|nr:glycoside hydrolase family 3 N-terminal domain-containing protein [Candidatus Pacearchaeota archaeon]
MKKKIIIFLILFILVCGFGFWGREIFSNNQKKNKTEAKSEENFNRLSDEELKERIGQMVMIGFRGTEVSENSDIIKIINNAKIGGVVLFDFDVPSKSFPRNILNYEQTKKLISDLKKYSSVPLFIAVDAEGGKVNRLKPEYGFLDIASPKELGELNNYEITKKEYLKLAKELRELGFNMNFAPVVDLNINAKNPIIGALNRSFSSNPDIVFIQAKVFIESLKENNIISVVKHFPGHGSSKNDSHLGIVDVTETYKEEEIIPYQKLNENNLLEAVMTAHIFNKKIDKNYPSTLSSIFLEDILRKKIGFSGVIISDDMQMGAISKNYGFEESIIKAINAGNDILLFSNNSSNNYDKDLGYKVTDIIYDAVKNGQISEKRIFESSERIYNLKRKFKII